MYLLDTCVLLMLGSAQDRLSSAARDVLENHADRLYVSAGSAFEIALKARLGKLELPLPARTWYSTCVERYRVEEIGINADIAVHSAELPLIHKDPVDRFIIASALEHKMIVLTSDEVFSRYPGLRVIW